jgi:hypothetical protein
VTRLNQKSAGPFWPQAMRAVLTPKIRYFQGVAKGVISLIELKALRCMREQLSKLERCGFIFIENSVGKGFCFSVFQCECKP